MARIPYSDPDRPEVGELRARIVKERGSVLHLYAMLLHSRPVADGWLRFLTAIRHECTLPAQLRELVIIQVAHLNGAKYEADQHMPIGLREGLSQAQIDVLPNWRGTGLFNVRQEAALAYCDAMTQKIHVGDDVFAAVKSAFTPQLIVELTATIGAYNMVSRFIEAIGIHSADDMAAA